MHRNSNTHTATAEKLVASWPKLTVEQQTRLSTIIGGRSD